jgi:phosphoribosylanthranilate isomerase|tara:strand:- start:3586 stop:4203 length:618 start_codon:yes stop_codon:yes gene_type:complete
MKIKVCGLNPTRDVQTCIDLNVHFLGFVFYDKSPRNTDLREISFLKRYNSKTSHYVSVCVDPTNNFIQENILGNFEYIQLHGSETSERVKEIKSMGIKVIKAIKIKEQKDVNLYKNYEDIADLILFDSTSMEKSQRIPKDLLYKLPKGKKFGLAGAINSENILEYSQLGFNFLDLSSGLERENLKGYKDHLKIKNFINKINDLKN